MGVDVIGKYGTGGRLSGDPVGVEHLALFRRQPKWDQHLKQEILTSEQSEIALTIV